MPRKAAADFTTGTTAERLRPPRLASSAGHHTGEAEASDRGPAGIFVQNASTRSLRQPAAALRAGKSDRNAFAMLVTKASNPRILSTRVKL